MNAIEITSIYTVAACLTHDSKTCNVTPNDLACFDYMKYTENCQSRYYVGSYTFYVREADVEDTLNDWC